MASSKVEKKGTGYFFAHHSLYCNKVTSLLLQKSSLSPFFFLLCLAAGTLLAQQPPSAKDEIRVCVLKDVSKAYLTIRGRYQMLALKTDEPLFSGASLDKALVSPTQAGLEIASRPIKLYGVKIIPQRKTAVEINGRRFRGEIDIIRSSDMTLLVINHINVEEYLYGVLYHEVSHWWPREVLKAQAIAARTYALYHHRINADRDYDLTSDVFSQVYGGLISERSRTNRAVNQTRGIVLTYKGEPFPAYYHATCGGMTQDASRLWKVDLPPLKGVRCKFCKGSPHYSWERVLDLSALERKPQFANAGRIIRIDVLARDATNRVSQIALQGEKATLTFSGKEFRLGLGPDLIRSENFEIDLLDSGRAKFKGIGWGHGVGLCQWGAYFMARKGYTAEAILRYYYPGSE